MNNALQFSHHQHMDLTSTSPSPQLQLHWKERRRRNVRRARSFYDQRIACITAWLTGAFEHTTRWVSYSEKVKE